ncbi:DUF3784 domain-containing protein [Clostridium sp.]|uniref:DUF3784 domain-containing protein n=1 Tax=Clostridium sp. TaxID=1506 RepID=UPI0034641516
MIAKILFIVLFVVLGIVLSIGKGAFLIAGLNTMSKEEKEKYDVLSLCKLMGKFMFIIAICITLFVLNDIFNIKFLTTIALVLFNVSLIFVIVYSNTGKRFEK